MSLETLKIDLKLYMKNKIFILGDTYNNYRYTHY